MVVPDNTELTRPRFVKSGNAIWLAFSDPIHSILKQIVDDAFECAGLEQPKGITIRVFTGTDKGKSAFDNRTGQKEYFRLKI